jgi:hypothetical protein
MNGSLAAAAFAAILAASSTARADGLAQTTPPPSAPVTSTFNANVRHPLFGWAGIGFYSVSLSVDVPGFGSVSGSSSYFGLNAGGVYDVIALAPDLPLGVMGNVAFAFGSDVFVPITVGAAVHYDKLPVQLLGGLGFTLMPHSGGGSTPLGVGLLLMGSYPLPQVRPGLSAYAQFQYHFLNDGFNLLVFNVGAELGF